MATTGEWRTVSRRRSFPDNWRRTATRPPPTTKPYTPFERTYAQVVASPPPSPPRSVNHNNNPPSPPHPTTQPPPQRQPPPQPRQPPLHTQQPPPRRPQPPRQPQPQPPRQPQPQPTRQPQPPRQPAPSTRPRSPPTKPHTFYVSPHSPTHLRFPPSPHFEEWFGRCFKCCKRGHAAAVCRNPRKCGKCWRDGHIGNTCNAQGLNPAATPFKPTVPRQHEPQFDELLAGTFPTNATIPENRPNNMVVFVERDEQYYSELTKLERAVVFHSTEVEVSCEEVATYATRTNLVKEEELQVSALARARHLIILPIGLTPETFIKAIPEYLWNMGYSFEPWCPVGDAPVRVPAFKALLHIIDLPPLLWREDVVRSAVAKFGLYLGSVAPQDPNDISYWAVAVGTDDLERIPKSISLVAGGIEYVAPVVIVTWQRGLIYDKSELPKPAPKVQRPATPSTSSAVEGEGSGYDEDIIPITRRWLEELTRDIDPSYIPAEEVHFWIRSRAERQM
ncbi:Major cell-surface adhesin PAc [Carex littledalei]|uniref:Major cell-surface adhesin PAc n=1 Tax=Carex littledalei TaxID=544730 RepID=A0A833VAV8_9POAL|nr:Major cell-surface adhesin PAc [Carex littledalei]